MDKKEVSFSVENIDTIGVIKKVVIFSKNDSISNVDDNKITCRVVTKDTFNSRGFTYQKNNNIIVSKISKLKRFIFLKVILIFT